MSGYDCRIKTWYVLQRVRGDTVLLGLGHFIIIGLEIVQKLYRNCTIIKFSFVFALAVRISTGGRDFCSPSPPHQRCRSRRSVEFFGIFISRTPTPVSNVSSSGSAARTKMSLCKQQANNSLAIIVPQQLIRTIIVRVGEFGVGTLSKAVIMFSISQVIAEVNNYLKVQNEIFKKSLI